MTRPAPKTRRAITFGCVSIWGQVAAEWGFRRHGLLGLDCQIQAKNGEAGRIYLVRLPDLAIRQEQMKWPDAQTI